MAGRWSVMVLAVVSASVCAGLPGARQRRRASSQLSADFTEYLIDEGLRDIAENNSMGLWFAVQTSKGLAEASFGYSACEPTDGRRNSRRTPAKTSDIIPAGSIAKGVIGLDTAVAPLADRFLSALGANTTLEDLYGTLITNVTLRDCLSMRVGAPDYSDSAVFRTTQESSRDLGPLEYLLNDTLTPNKKTSWRCGNASACNPPLYNSMGFMLLGLALGGHLQLTAWEQLDFKAVLPPNLRADPTYDGLIFFQHGPCSKYSNVAHFYSPIRRDAWTDQWPKSCLNGWSFGNIGVTAGAAASFFWDLVGRNPRIVSPLAVKRMEQWGEVLSDHYWERYGLGLMLLPLERYAEMNTTIVGSEPYAYAIGHNGADYGTYVHAGYHPSLDASFAFGMNKDMYLWVKHRLQGNDDDGIFCRAWRAVFRLTGHGALGDASLNCNGRGWRTTTPHPIPNYE